MWVIILSTEPGAFRLDERRWEDRKTILITAPKSVPVGAQQIPPRPYELPSWSDQAHPEKRRDKELSKPPSPEPPRLAVALHPSERLARLL